MFPWFSSKDPPIPTSELQAATAVAKSLREEPERWKYSSDAVGYELTRDDGVGVWTVSTPYLQRIGLKHPNASSAELTFGAKRLVYQALDDWHSQRRKRTFAAIVQA